MSSPAGDVSGCRIYPAFNALYYSFYLAGLRELYGRSGVDYRRGSFPRFGHHGLAVETVGKNPKKLFISASDGPILQPEALSWCDVLGKANLNPADVPARDKSRCLAIGPSFPVRLWAPAVAMTRALANYVLSRGRVDSPREHFANFRRQYVYRMPLNAYQPEPSKPRYIFFASSLWKKEAATNRYRAHFIKACQSVPGLDFEGGFVRRTHNDIPGFEPLTVDKRYPAAEYHRKIKQSAVVFNTPAVASCHGWKLAEFLALGKAIVSTPPIRALPAPLVHGVHFHLVDGSEAAIHSAVERLLEDVEYRRRLEENARAYYLKYLSPTRVIQRLLEAAQER